MDPHATCRALLDAVVSSAQLFLQRLPFSFFHTSALNDAALQVIIALELEKHLEPRWAYVVEPDVRGVIVVSLHNRSRLEDERELPLAPFVAVLELKYLRLGNLHAPKLRRYRGFALQPNESLVNSPAVLRRRQQIFSETTNEDLRQWSSIPPGKPQKTVHSIVQDAMKSAKSYARGKMGSRLQGDTECLAVSIVGIVNRVLVEYEPVRVRATLHA